MPWLLKEDHKCCLDTNNSLAFCHDEQNDVKEKDISMGTPKRKGGQTAAKIGMLDTLKAKKEGRALVDMSPAPTLLPHAWLLVLSQRRTKMLAMNAMGSKRN